MYFIQSKKYQKERFITNNNLNITIVRLINYTKTIIRTQLNHLIK